MSNNDPSIADALDNKLGVTELRKICSENGVSRKRGASKAETVAALINQAPEAAAKAAGVSVTQTQPGYTLICTCGLEKLIDDRDEAVSEAKDHLRDCKKGMGVTGNGGLSVWSDKSGAPTWNIDDGDIPHSD